MNPAVFPASIRVGDTLHGARVVMVACDARNFPVVILYSDGRRWVRPTRPVAG